MLLTDSIKYFLDNNIPFVSYRLPSYNQPITQIGGSFSTKAQDSPKIENQFILAPFDKDNFAVQYYHPEKEISGWEFKFEVNTTKYKIDSQMNMVEKPIITDYVSYINQAELLISAMQKHELEKVVLSKIKEYSLRENTHFGKIFEKACQKYPKAFVYLLNDGHGQFWMGATPELLLNISSGNGSTMALAGTQPIENQLLYRLQWGEKEMKEHAFVAQYIKDTLQKQFVSNLQISPRTTIQAGQMAHLQTNFSFRLNAKSDALQIANALHPTPAVCGLPKEKVFQTITSTEKHLRSFYTGFLGTFTEKSDCSLFVNLRCMQIIDNKAYIYVGGGLTSQSDPQNEWDETELKAGTMLSLFE